MIKNASDSRIGASIVRTAQALRLAVLPHNPRTIAWSVDVAPDASTEVAIRKANPAVTIVDTNTWWGSGHVVDSAYRRTAPTAPPATRASGCISGRR